MPSQPENDHSAQYALAAMLEAANEGVFNFIESVREYGKRASVMKKLFTENGFSIVYDKDMDEPIADGFYFTISYPGMSGADFLRICFITVYLRFVLILLEVNTQKD